MSSQPSALSSQLATHPKRRRAAFALLIVLTLLAFLVLLLVGLATFTRVETAVAGNSQRQLQARENALLALDVALDQLQKAAGPDQRVTATAEAFGNANAKHYTGVWDARTTGTTVATILVSGSELTSNASVLLNLNLTATTSAELVGTNTSGTPLDVRAPLVPITSVGVPGITTTAGGPIIGQYAWWVGDQGVKAPVALGDRTNTITYAPYNSTELRGRLRQQLSLGAGAAAFEPRTTTNSGLVTNLSDFNQLAYLRTSTTSTATVGLATLRPNYFVWSPNNQAVLTNSKTGGLKQDVSLKPDLLGAAIQSWLNYSAYMEQPVAGGSAAPSPDYTSPQLRRRYVLQQGAPSVSPVLSYFLLTFNVRTQGGSTAVKPIEVRTRWMISLWNPFTGSLVPEDLRIEVSGLPTIRLDDQATGIVAVPAFPLHTVYGSPLKISLPWNPGSNVGSGGDTASWLPGRVYTWTALEDTSGASPAAAGYLSRFYSRNLNGDAGQGVQRLAPGSAAVDGDKLCHVDGDATTLQIKLYAVRSGGDVQLATFTSPSFDQFSTTPQKLSGGNYQFSYVFRLAESADAQPWLTTAGVDPHAGSLSSASYAYFASVLNPTSPASFAGFTSISAADRLLDRATDNFSYDRDAPVFEFPRAPVLSLGALQHVAFAGQRPFAFGNSWGSGMAIDSGITTAQAFDQFFFSGVTATSSSPVLGAGQLFPDPLLKTIPRKSTGAAVALSDITAQNGTGYSSKYLLHGGAFNLNSVNRDAWVAMLRCVRFPAPQSFTYLESSFATGTAGDTTTTPLSSSNAQFFRFSQSAQETYKISPPTSSSTYAASTVESPALPNPQSQANTHLFRQGMRTLDSSQVTALAAQIFWRVQKKQKATGPFRSLEEFLGPSDLFGNKSLLESAIAGDDPTDPIPEIDLNSSIAEFSSQWLTQADIMTALAPVLYPRSDTFVIRAYGEAVNAVLVTGNTVPRTAVEGRAWCEAVVQRVPEYFDASDVEETAPAALNATNRTYGRRFKIISFRWLTRSDI